VGKIASYRDLVAWQKAMQVVTAIYRLTQGFPKEELFSLTNQIRRAAVSIPCNIAEGQGRSSRKEFQYFLANARGSLWELETQILIAKNLNYLAEEETDQFLETSTELGKVLNGLIIALKK
jgi:four helix bundle protein